MAEINEYGEEQLNPNTGLVDSKKSNSIFDVDTSNINIPKESSNSIFDVDTSQLYLDIQESEIQPIDLSSFDEEELASRVGSFTGDPTKQLAASQSGLAQFTGMAVRIPTKVATGLIESAGIVGDALFDWDVKDYSNALTEFARGANKDIDKGSTALPGLYRENPNQVFDAFDPAWWISNAEGLTSSMIQFGTVSAGAAALFGKGLGAAAQAISNSAKLAQKAQGLAVGLTAASGAYIEGAMSGAQVYKDTYDIALKQGLSAREAVKLASESAAKTTYANTVINTFLNVSSVMPFFRSVDQFADAQKYGLTKQILQDGTRESTEEYAKRLKTLLGSNPNVQDNWKKILGHSLIEGTQEAGEELVNLGAEGYGYYNTDLKLGRLTEEEKQDGALYNSLKTMYSQEGALSALLGFVGGAGQKAFIENMPRVGFEKEKLKLKLSPAKQQQLERQKASDNMILSLTNTIESISGLQDKLQEKVKQLETDPDKTSWLEVEEIQDQLFNIGVARHIFSGTDNLLKEMMEDISNTDNTQEVSPGKTKAMLLGYAKDKNDNEYKEKAKDKINTIDKLVSEFKTITSKYGGTDVESYPYTQHLFYLHNNKLSIDESIKQYKSALNKVEVEHIRKNEDNFFGTRDYKLEQLNSEKKAIEIAIERYEEERIAAKEAYDNSDKKSSLFSVYGTTNLKEINETIDDAIKQLERKKHQAELALSVEKTEAMKDMQDKSKEQREQREKEIEEVLKEENLYNSLEKILLTNYRAGLVKSSLDSKLFDKAFNKLTSKEGKKNYKKSIDDIIEKKNKKEEEKTSVEEKKEAVKEVIKADEANKESKKEEEKKEEPKPETKQKQPIVEKSVQPKPQIEKKSIKVTTEKRIGVKSIKEVELIAAEHNKQLNELGLHISLFDITHSLIGKDKYGNLLTEDGDSISDEDFESWLDPELNGIVEVIFKEESTLTENEISKVVDLGNETIIDEDEDIEISDVDLKNKTEDLKNTLEDRNRRSGSKNINGNTLAYRSTEIGKTERLHGADTLYIEHMNSLSPGTELNVTVSIASMSGITEYIDETGAKQEVEQDKVKRNFLKVLQRIQEKIEDQKIKTFNQAFSLVKEELEKEYKDLSQEDKKTNVNSLDYIIKNVVVNITNNNKKLKSFLHHPYWYSEATIALTMEEIKDLSEEEQAEALKIKIDKLRKINYQNRLNLIKGLLQEAWFKNKYDESTEYTLKTKVLAKGMGHISLNTNGDNELVYKPISTLGSDNFMLAVYNKGEFNFIHGKQVEVTEVDKQGYQNGGVYIIIPTANGNFIPVKAKKKKLGDIKNKVIDSIINALKVYNLSLDLSDVNPELQEKLKTKEGLQNYLKQFIYTTYKKTNFDEKVENIKRKNPKGEYPIYLFSGEKGYTFTFGSYIPFQTAEPLTFDRSTMKLNEKALRETLAKTLLNINSSSILKSENANIEFIEINKEGKAEIVNINRKDFIFENLESALHKEEYENFPIYFEQPTIVFDSDMLNNQFLDRVIEKKEIQEREKRRTETTTQKVESKVEQIASNKIVFENIEDTEDEDSSEVYKLVNSDTLSKISEDISIKGLYPGERILVTRSIVNKIGTLFIKYTNEGVSKSFNDLLNETKDWLRTEIYNKLITKNTEKGNKEADLILSLTSDESWNKLVNLYVKKELKKNGILIKDNQDKLDVLDNEQNVNEEISEEGDETLETIDTSNVKDYFDDGATFMKDPREKLSVELRLLLNNILDVKRYYIKDGREIKVVDNHIGLRPTVDPTKLINELYDILSDIVPGIDDSKTPLDLMLETLYKQSLKTDKLYLKEVADTIKIAPEFIQNAFVAKFRLRDTRGTSILINNKEEGLDATVKLTNNNNKATLLIDKWKNTFYQSKLVTHDSEGNMIFNKEELNKIRNIEQVGIDEITRLRQEDEDDSEQLRLNDITALNTLKQFGIDVEESLYSRIEKFAKENPIEFRKLTKENTFDKFISYTIYRLAYNSANLYEKNKGDGKTEIEKFESYNPYNKKNKSFKSALDALANVLAVFDKELTVSMSYQRDDNRTVFGKQMPTVTTNLATRFKEKDKRLIQALLRGAFTKNSTYLKRIQEDNSFQRIFELGLFETIKFTDDKDNKGKTISDMNDKEFELARLLAFQHSHAKGSEDEFISTFVWPTPADSSTFPSITALKRNIRGKVTIVKNPETNQPTAVNYELRKRTSEEGGLIALYNDIKELALSEINRIIQVKKNLLKAKELGEIKDNVGFYRKEKKDGKETGKVVGELFVLFPFLNDNKELADTLEYSVANENIITPQLLENVLDIIDEHLKKEVAIIKNKWVSLNIVELDEKRNIEKLNFDNNYIEEVKNSILAGFNTTPMHTALANNKNIINDLILNYAANDYVYNYAIAYGNIYQLFSGDPALASKEDIAKTIDEVTKRTVKDRGTSEQANWNFQRYDGSKVGFTYNVAYTEDAKTSNVEELISKVGEIIGLEEAQAYRKSNPTDAQEWITGQEHLDIMYSHGLLTREKYDKLSRGMKEENLSIEDLREILGSTKAIQITKPLQVVHKLLDEGLRGVVYIKSSAIPLIPQLIKGLDLENLYNSMNDKNIQRVVAISAAKIGARNIVQVFDDNGKVKRNLDLTDKADLLTREGFGIQQEIPYDPNKNKILEVSQVMKLLFEGTPSYLDQLKSEYVELHKQLMILGKEKLLEELGVELLGGEYIIKDLKKLKDLLQKEAIERGYSYVNIASLELTPDGRHFSIPLDFTLATQELESLLASLFKNRVVKQKISGNSYVQISESGIVKQLGYDKLSNKNKSAIVFVNKEAGKKELQFISKDNPYMEVYVPWNFKDNDGNDLDIKDFLDENGNLDTSLLDDDMLNLIGMRIPNQGHNSMAPMKIMGFLPKGMLNAIVVPAGITVQMGSDFDIDKLYSYMYNYKIEQTIFGKKKIYKLQYKEGSKNRKEIENRLIDIQKQVLQDPYVIKKMVKPLDTGNMKEVAEEIESLISKGKKKEAGWLLSTNFQDEVRKTNKDGKAGISFFSIISTLNASLQGRGVELMFDVAFEGKKNSKLGMIELLTRMDRTPQEVISYMQSASVDNAKDKLLAKLGLTEETFGAAAIMALAGYDIDTIGYFINQPIIRRYIMFIKSAEFKNKNKIRVNKEKIAKDIQKSYMTKVSDKEYKASLDRSYTNKELKSFLEEGKRTEDYFKAQIDLLERFVTFTNAKEELMKLNIVFNNTTKAIGKSVVESVIKENKFDSLFNTEYFHGLYKLLGDVTLNKEGEVDGFNFTTIEGHAFEQGTKTANKVFSNLFIYNSPAFNHMREVLETVGIRTDKPNEIRTITEALRTYIYTIQNSKLFKDESLSETRKRLFFDNKKTGHKSLMTRVREAKTGNDSDLRANRLLKRLQPIFSNNINNPSRIEYKGEFVNNEITELENIDALVTLLSSSNEEHRQLGYDLIRYILLTRAQNSSISFYRFIPFGKLPELGIDANLREIHSEANKDINLFRPFVKQYLQHNPNKAYIFNYEQVSEATRAKLEEGEPIDKINFKQLKKDQILSPYISYKDKKGNWKLYERTEEEKWFEVEEDGALKNIKHVVYKQIDTLGDQQFKSGMNEYSYGNTQQTSILKENNAFIKDIKPTFKPKTSSKTSDVIVKNVQGKPISMTRLGVEEGVHNITMIKSILSNMETIDDLPESYKAIASLFRTKLRLPIEFRVVDFANEMKFNSKISIDDKGAAYTEKGKTFILINTNSEAFVDNTEDLSRTILHELTHALTIKAIEDNGVLNMFDQNSQKASKPVQELARILNYVKDEIRKGNVEGLNGKDMDDVHAKLRDKKSLSSEEILKYYPLYNTAEFVAETISNVKFQESLSKIKSKKDESILELIWKNLRNLYEAIFGVKKDSIGIEAIDEIMKLIDYSQSMDNLETVDLGSKDNPNLNIYARLSVYPKTENNNVRIVKKYQKEGVEYAKSIGGIYSMRLNYSKIHFGNPFTHEKMLAIQDNLILVNSVKEAVEAYIDWLTTDKYLNVEPERRAWILKQLGEGKLKNRSITYYKELNEPSHANALDYLINKYDWNRKELQSEPTYKLISDNQVLEMMKKCGI